MNKKIAFLAALTLLVAGGVATGVMLKANSTQEETSLTTERQATDSLTGLSLRYIAPLQVEQLTEQDKKDKFVFRLTSLDPAMLVSVRYEDGLRGVAAAARQSPLDLILGNAAKSLAQRYQGFQQLQQNKLTSNDRDAAEIIFTYTGPKGETAKQRLIIIIKDADTAVYIAAQTREDQFPELTTKYFDKLVSSITFN